MGLGLRIASANGLALACLLLLGAPAFAAPLPMPPTLCPTGDTKPTLTPTGDAHVSGDQAYLVGAGSAGLYFEDSISPARDSVSVVNSVAIDSTGTPNPGIEFYGAFGTICYDGSATASIESGDTGIAVTELSDGDVLLYIAHAIASGYAGIEVEHGGNGLVDIKTGAIVAGDAGIIVSRVGKGDTRILARGAIGSVGPGIVVFHEPGATGDIGIETRADVASDDSGIAVVHAGDTGSISIRTARGTTISAHGGFGPPLSGGPTGIYVERSGSGTPAPAGDISIVNRADIDADYAGILVDVCGCVRTDVSIVSTGDLEAGDGAGIYVSHVGDGDVTVTQTGAITSANGGGILVYKEGGGDVSVSATGGIDSHAGAVYAFVDGAGTLGVDLAGTIVSHTGAPAVLAVTSGRARIASAADITSEIGIFAGGPDVRVDLKRGTIESEQAVGAFGDTVDLRIGRRAGIVVTSPAGSGVVIDATTARVEIAGSIDAAGTGALVFNTGTGRLTLLPGFRIEGSVTAGGAGGDVLRFGGSGSATFDLDRVGTQFTGFDQLVKTGTSDWTFTGPAFGGELRAEKGIVRVDTDIPGLDLRLEGSGTLKGNGTIGSLMAEGGSVAPGNSIGTLHIAGGAAMQAGSTYQVEVDGAGGNDRIEVGGTATLDTAATVGVTMQPGPYGLVTRYTIMSAAGGIVGAFDDDVLMNTAFFDGAVDYDLDNVYLTLTRNAMTLGDFAGTPNQRAIAAALEDAGTASPYFGELFLLPASAVAPALDSLSGDAYPSLAAAALDDGRFLRDAMLDRRGARGVWTASYGGISRLPGDGNGPAVDHAAGGLLLGADAGIGDGWLGLMLGYSQSRDDVAARETSARSGEFSIGAYGGTGWDAFYASFGTTLSGRDISATRRVSFPGVSDTFTAGYASVTAQAFTELGYRIDLDGTAITPFGGLAGLHAVTSGLTEKGSGAGALAVDPGTAGALVATLGLRLEHDVALDAGRTFTLRASAAWRHAVGGASATATTAGATRFTVDGTPLAADTLAVSAGAGVVLDRFSLGLDYSGSLGSGGAAGALSATLAGQF